MEFHLTMRVEHNRHEGMAAEEAGDAARRTFGNTTPAAEDVRRVYVSEWLESLVQDVRYGARSFLRTPGFTLAAVFAIALGSGSATAVFSVVDRILFRALPYPAEERLV